MSLQVEIEKKLNDKVLSVSFDTEGKQGITGILGASGCGKSMTLKCIAGIETPDRGKIVFDLLNSGVRWTRKGRPIRKVAVLGGAGGDYLHPAAAAGADALVTGEAKHHEYLEAVRMGITLLDATHYATEQVVLRPLAEYLTACCPDVRFAVGCGGDALCFTGGCRG